MFHWSSFVKYYAKNYIYIIESEGDAGVLKGWGFLSPKEMKSIVGDYNDQERH